MLKIYCETCWLILEDIEIIFFEKKLTCVYAVMLSVDACFTHVILILHS